jgi:hypothetical protein
MARWLVQLNGERVDLQEFLGDFPDGEIHVLEEDGIVYLAGPAFEALGDAGAVSHAAEEHLAAMFAAARLSWSSLRQPSLGATYRHHDDGHRDAFIFVEGRIEPRSRLYAMAVSTGPAPAVPRPTPAQDRLSKSLASAPLQAAMEIWSQPAPTWPQLYRLLGELEGHLGQTVAKAGFCSDAERTRFTQTANSKAAGLDARHAHGEVKPPKKPMTLKDARTFAGALLAKTLDAV